MEFTKALKLEPDSAAIKQNLGLMRLEQDRVAEARALFGEALNRTSDSEKNLKSTILVNLGYSFLLEGRLDWALYYYRTALNLNPVKPDPYSRLVESRSRTAHLTNSSESSRTPRRITDPGDADGVDKVFLPEQAIVYALGLQGKYAEIVARTTKDLEALQGVKTDIASRLILIPTPFFVFWNRTTGKHIDTAPIKESLLIHRAQAYLKQGMLDEAIADFKQIADIGKLAPIRYYGLGLVALEQGDGKEATYDLRRYTEAQPKDAAGLLYYSAALQLSGEAAVAEGVLKRMQERPPLGLHPSRAASNSSRRRPSSIRFGSAMTERSPATSGCSPPTPPMATFIGRWAKFSSSGAKKVKAREVLLKAADLCPRDVVIPRLLEKADVHAAMAP